MMTVDQVRRWPEPRALDMVHVAPASPVIMPHDGPQLLTAFCLTLAFAGDAALRLAWSRVTTNLGVR